MEPLRHAPIAPGKILGAWVCLAAAVLLWAPMWAAALQSNGLTCCNGSMCAAHGHSKPSQRRPEKTSPSEAPMACDHHGTDGLTDCAMSCSQESTSSLTSAVIFLLPEPASVSEPAVAIAAPAEFAPMEFARLFEPPSPPPRISLFSL